VLSGDVVAGGTVFFFFFFFFLCETHFSRESK